MMSFYDQLPGNVNYLQNNHLIGLYNLPLDDKARKDQAPVASWSTDLHYVFA